MNTKLSKIFVDGNCIVCDWEISKYKQMAPTEFEIVDISDPSFDAARYGLTPEKVNRHMHVLTPDGDVLIGVDAFSHIWTRIPKLNWASKAIHWPVVYPLAKVGYEVFVVVRPWLPKKK